ncbi:hypothetical protein SAMN04487761_1291 [Lachnospiraceae bacterium C7]|nr:hypothetical protein SAMN04487761_1291 [Lachnospiraceae bacterium C7]
MKKVITSICLMALLVSSVFNTTPQTTHAQVYNPTVECKKVSKVSKRRATPSVTSHKQKTVQDFVHGSAETPEGTTIVISLFASDTRYSWNRSCKKDRVSIHNINKYLGIAGDYLEDITKEYGKKANFITDFEKNKDLAYFTQFSIDLEDNGSGKDESIWNFIDANIDVNGLMAKYKADNVVFLTCMNTDENSQAVTCTRNWYEGMPSPYEIVYMYNVDYQEVNPPAVYAHEILHTFGAPDLYAKSTELNFSDEFMNYVRTSMGNDLMYTCSDKPTGSYLYDSITNEVSELDAYYCGLTNDSSVVRQFGLGTATSGTGAAGQH